MADTPGKGPTSKGEAQLKQYWGHGVGALKIRWGQPGDFNRCVLEVGRYIHNERELKGFCANVHHDVLGTWPGDHDGDGKRDS